MLQFFKRLFHKNEKVFVIGFNKTGTTTIEHALKEFGYNLGDQYAGEKLLKDLSKGEYSRLKTFVKTAEAFQDVPFSLPGIYEMLYEWYPNAKFILSIRDNEDQWFNSISKFHSKLFDQKHPPSETQLKSYNYCYPGFLYDYMNFVFKVSSYDPEILKNTYLKHNEDVLRFFQRVNGQLCIVNVSNDEDYKKMCEFLRQNPKRTSFEWRNKT